MSPPERNRQACPHCGARLAPAGGEDAAHASSEAPRYDLEQLAAIAATDRAHDETTKVRVNQDDIRKLVAKGRRKAS